MQMREWMTMLRRLALLVSLLLIVSAGCRPVGQSETLMSDTDDIVAMLSNLDFRRHEAAWPTVTSRPRDIPGGYPDLIPVPQPGDIAHDLPRYFVYKAPRSAHFWVLRTGGIVAEQQWYGPLMLTGSGELLRPAMKTEK